MAYTANVYQGNHIAATDLQNIENNFEYLRTNFLGAGAPADPGGGLEGVIWRDNNKDLLKVRGTSGWLGILALAAESTNGLIWFHGDDLSAQEGWAIDTSITEDRVMALKNHGAGTYTTGRAVAGSWTISGLTDSGHGHNHSHSHSHKWYDYISTGNPNLTGAGDDPATLLRTDKGIQWSTDNVHKPSEDLYTDTNATTDNTSGNAAIVSDATYRVRAQVGIVIYPDI